MQKVLMVLVCLILGNSFTILAQEEPDPLKRKAILGIMMEEVQDGDVTNVRITEVMEEGSADKIGIEAGDILISINGSYISRIPSVQVAMSSLRLDDELSLSILRKNTKMDLKGNAVGRPMEDSETGEVLYDSFKMDGHHIRTIWHFPSQIKKPPVVFFLQGYICQSTDFGASPQNPAKKLIDDWVKAGYAVYRMEKAGHGDSISRKTCMDMDFNEELELFREGYEYLLSSGRVKTKEVYLFGHSMGATIAPMLAKQNIPAGIITYGATGNKWADYMDAIVTKQGVHFGQSQSEIMESSGPALAFVDKYLRQQVEVENLLNDEEVVRYLEENNLKQAFEGGTYLMRSHEFWRSLSNLDMLAVWEETKAPVYSLHGTLDIQAINKDEAQSIVDAVNRGSSQATLQLIQGADHGFVSFETMEQNVEVLGSGQYRIHAVNNYHPGIAIESVKWMNLQRGLSCQ